MQDEAPRRLVGPAAAAGLAAQTVQVVCLREIFQVARGGEAVLGLALAAWLIGTSLGAWTWRGRRGAAALLVVLVPVALVPILRALPVWTGGWAPGAALLAAVGAYPTGAFFAAVLRGGGPRGALALEAGGACVAGTLLTFLLLGLLPAATLLLLAAAACVPVRALALGLVLAALPAGLAVDRATLPPATVDSPYGRLVWEPYGNQHSLYVNGQLAFTSPDEIGAEAFVNVVLASHPAPERVLVIGAGGLAGVLRECRRHPVRQLDLALQDPALLDLVRADLTEADRAALDAARVLVGDPRRAAAAEARDVVLVLAPPPLTLAANRFHTREFFASVRLRPGGLVATRLPAAPNEREGQVMARNVSVFRAMDPLIVRVLPGASDLLLARAGAAPDTEPAVLAARLAARGIVLRHHAQDFFAEPFRAEEVARVTRAYRDYPARPPPAVPFPVAETEPANPPPAVLPNRDLHPGAVLHAAAALAREEQAPLLRLATFASRATPLLLLPLAALGALLAWRHGRATAAALATATSGAASMGLWVVLLGAHQARVGALYGDLALLAAAFMLGFAAGALRGARPLRVDAAFLGVCVVVWLALPYGGRTLYALLAVAVGAAGGATVGAAAAAFPARASRLYAWDLLGAAVAAVLFGTFLLPALGATGACLTAAGLKAFSLLGARLALSAPRAGSLSHPA